MHHRHYVSKQTVQEHLCSFGNVVYVDFRYRQVNCPDCGKVVEKLDFVEPYARITTRLAEAVSQMCEHMSIDEVVFRLKNC